MEHGCTLWCLAMANYAVVYVGSLQTWRGSLQNSGEEAYKQRGRLQKRRGSLQKWGGSLEEHGGSLQKRGPKPTKAERKPTKVGRKPRRAGRKPRKAGRKPTKAGRKPTKAGRKPTKAGRKPRRAGRDLKSGEEASNSRRTGRCCTPYPQLRKSAQAHRGALDPQERHRQVVASILDQYFALGKDPGALSHCVHASAWVRLCVWCWLGIESVLVAAQTGVDWTRQWICGRLQTRWQIPVVCKDRLSKGRPLTVIFPGL